MTMNNLGVALSQNGQVNAAVSMHQDVLALLDDARAAGTAEADDWYYWAPRGPNWD